MRSARSRVVRFRDLARLFRWLLIPMILAQSTVAMQLPIASPVPDTQEGSISLIGWDGVTPISYSVMIEIETETETKTQEMLEEGVLRTEHYQSVNLVAQPGVSATLTIDGAGVFLDSVVSAISDEDGEFHFYLELETADESADIVENINQNRTIAPAATPTLGRFVVKVRDPIYSYISVGQKVSLTSESGITTSIRTNEIGEAEFLLPVGNYVLEIDAFGVMDDFGAVGITISEDPGNYLATPALLDGGFL